MSLQEGLTGQIRKVMIREDTAPFRVSELVAHYLVRMIVLALSRFVF